MQWYLVLGLDTIYVRKYENIKYVGAGVREIFQSAPPLRISNGIALSWYNPSQAYTVKHVIPTAHRNNGQ